MQFEYNGQRITGPEAIFLTVVNPFFVIVNLVTSVIMLIPAYALAAWLLSLTPVGTWVAAGLKLLYINVQREDLYKLGAAIGFIKCFLARSVKQPCLQKK